MKASTLWMAFSIIMVLAGLSFFALALWDYNAKHDTYSAVVILGGGLILISGALLGYFNMQNALRKEVH